MSEKFNFDFAKLGNQEKFKSLEKEQGDVVGKDQEKTDKNIGKDRRMELIKKHHEFAMVMYDLEKFLTGSEYILKYDQLLNSRLATLPEKIRQNFEEAVQNYRVRMLRMKNHIDDLTEIIEEKCHYGMPRSSTNQEVANMLWRSLINKGYAAPVGKIEYEMKEGYLALFFERVEDYQRAKRKDMYIDVSKIEDSGGCYMHSAYIRTFKDEYYGPVLLIRKDQKDADVIMKHERQHYINNKIFDDFSLTEDKRMVEGKDELDVENIQKLRRIKDEIIAYIRSANDFRFNFKNTMHSELYGHLFKGLDEKYIGEVDNILELLGKFFEDKKSKNQLEDDSWCSIMTYQLSSVPLLKFPHWLKALDDYYAKRLEMFRQFNLFVNRSGLKFGENDWKHQVFERRYSKYYQDYVNENSKYARQLIENIEATEDDAIDIVFDQEITFDQMEIEIVKVKNKYDTLLAEFSRICEFLKKDGVLVPNSSPPESYGYGESADDAFDDESEFLAEVQQQLLIGIENYPQSELDKIIKSVCMEEEVDGNEVPMRKFINYLKKIVHLKNNSRPCTVYVYGDDDYDNNAAYVVLDFLVSPEENKRGVKGGQIMINIHSSELIF